MAQGDFKEEEFTDEEKAALGEVDDSKKDEGKPPDEADQKDDKPPEDGKPPEDDKPPEGKTEDEQKPDAETQAVIDEQGAKLITENGKQYVVDDEGSKIPLERFKKVYGRSKELEREKEEIENKHNLFKTLGAEKYYEVYPDEKPADFKPAAPPTPPPQYEDLNKMVVKGGQYDGWTIEEVAKENVAAATIMINNYLDGKRRAEETERNKQEEFNRNFNNERNTFLYERAKEIYQKTEGYTQDEINGVNAVYQKLSQWMITEKKTHYKLEDAWKLMNHDEIVKKARIEAGKEALKKATDKKVTPSIGNGDSKAGLTGFDNVMAMTEDQLTDHISKMTDKEFVKFTKDAPKALKDKYPNLPW